MKVVGAALAASICLMIAGCTEQRALPVPERTEPAYTAKDALPVLLFDASSAGMEALITGRLRRAGPCLLLDTGEGGNVILWGSENYRVEEDEIRGWAVMLPNGDRVGEGDWLRGGGGHYGQSAQDLATVNPPAPCAQREAVQFHSVAAISPPVSEDTAPSAPPIPPPAPTIIDSVKRGDTPASGAPQIVIDGIADAREALFFHVISESRTASSGGAFPACLQDADADLVARLNDRLGNVFAASACGWKEGGIILKSTGDRANFFHAHIDCTGKVCAAEGGRTYGNLGGEGYGYTMHRTVKGWTIERLGISWIS